MESITASMMGHSTSIVKVLKEKPYMAEDENENLIVDPEICASGLLVNVTRKSVVNYFNQMSVEESNKILHQFDDKGYHFSKMPDLEAVYFWGKPINKIKKKYNPNINTGILCERIVDRMDRYTAAVLKCASYSYFTFIRSNGSIYRGDIMIYV